ncbi:MAG: DUF3791 domain-containing protein [Treponema sp.]|nr:DUF3791 domain-containing protein [Treponema sp.]
MKADKTILGLKYSSVIVEFANECDITLREALDKFYKSQIYAEMREGISDMHCRSDKYLAEELMQEFELHKSPFPVE